MNDPAAPIIYLPVTPFHVNQNFGDNMPCVKDFGLATQSIVTGADNKTCPVGYDKLYSHFGMSGHNGTDLMAREQNLYAAMDGVVVEKQLVPARGLGLGILSNDILDLGLHGKHYLKLRYWHLKTMYVEVGDTVKAGQLIGVTNNTGYSSGDHLHFEGQPMDKDAGGHPVLAFPNGGDGVIASAINIAPWFSTTYAKDVPQAISLTQSLVVLLQQIIAQLRPKATQ